MPNPARHTSVAIVGGGPVGTALAIELGLRGIECTIIERHREPQPVPKGQNLTQRTVEHFRAWGIEDDLRAARTMSRGQRAAGMTSYGTLLGDHHYSWMQRERVGQFYSAANERLPQYATERVLRRRAAQLPRVTTLYDWTAETITTTGESATIEMVSKSGEREILSADWVVACDGARSVVRERAGITQTRADHDRLMVLAVIRSAEFDRLMLRFPDVTFANVLHPDLEGYWQFFGRVDAQETWFFHAPVDPGSTAETLDLAPILTRAVGTEFAFQIEYLGFWDLRFTLADQYRAGRVLVAGDAAHSHPPYGGYGINTGFEDAVNLGWKLAAELGGWAGPHLLDSYDAERRPVFASTRDDFIDRSIRVDREFVASFDPALDEKAFAAAWDRRADEAQGEVALFEPHYDGSPIIPAPSAGGPSAVGTHEHRARAGHHLAPGTTATGGAVFDALGTGFSLLVADADAARPFVDAAERRGAPLRVVTISGDSSTLYGAAAILVRPDQFVAWAGDPATAAARDLFDTAIGF